MPFITQQVAKINTESNFFFNSEILSYPIAPLVSTRFFQDKNNVKTMKTRIVVFIDERNKSIPKIGEHKIENNKLTVFIDYDYSDKIPKKGYTAWYFEFEFTSPQIEAIDTLETYLRDIDPVLSRGTVTMVQG